MHETSRSHPLEKKRANTGTKRRRMGGGGRVDAGGEESALEGRVHSIIGALVTGGTVDPRCF